MDNALNSQSTSTDTRSTSALKQTFLDLIRNYTADSALIEKSWNEIETEYSRKSRHYHTLNHLDNLLNLLSEIRGQITDWNKVLFGLYYHDIVYNTLKTNNEEESAVFAGKRMAELSIPTPMIRKCMDIILATKKHRLSQDNDTNIFTDADLSILGADWTTYWKYYKQIRIEYSIYPDIIYNPGRRKVLQHFLDMNRIFKTDYFFEKYEQQARQNLKSELELL